MIHMDHFEEVQQSYACDSLMTLTSLCLNVSNAAVPSTVKGQKQVPTDERFT